MANNSRHVMRAAVRDYQKMSDAEKQAALAPHGAVMAEALEKVALAMQRRTPGGKTLRAWTAETLANPAIGEGVRWDAQAAQALIDALDAIGSGAIL